jgi:2-keto-4-pentenoate hydratase/2-oxohepta-3-ene-1,7-dioic acid hydratase in catechol pathway
MRFLTFTAPGESSPRVGLLNAQQQVIDLTQVAGKPPFDPRDLLSLIAAGDEALAWARKVAASSGQAALDPAKLRLLAPIPRPRKNVFCVGWNYLEHFAEGEKNRAAKVDYPAHPVFFSKAVTAVMGPYDPIPVDATLTTTLDWEAEFGVVIGKGGINIKEADAMNHVFGYTVINDVSARDIQRRHGGQWFKGKSLDGTCPMGPHIVTRDELDPASLGIMCRVNGVTKQDSNTSYMYFKLPRLIAELSLGLTLEPGDVISTGTPPGVGSGRTPPEYLKAGDVVETEIAGIGVLRNVVCG